MKPGPLIILSGPSGSGKSTLIREVLRTSGLPLRLSVSATTRGRRNQEQDGVDYYFWTAERFRRELAAGAFLEHAEVHGNLYGTLRSEVDDYRARGVGVLLDIDVQGAAQVRPHYPDHLSVFVCTSSEELLAQRLRQRGTEDEAALARRLAAAQRELARAQEYQHVVINDELAPAAAQLTELIRQRF
jgi:guanylate kinase